MSAAASSSGDVPAPKRRLILHFNIPRTILLGDIDGIGSNPDTAGETGTCLLADPDAASSACYSTEQVLQQTIASVSWGSIDLQTKEWVLDERAEPSATAPSGTDLVTYSEYLEMLFPTGRIAALGRLEDGGDGGATEQDDFTATKNRATQRTRIMEFTNPGMPGARMRPAYDQMVKCLAFGKVLIGATGVGKVPILEEKAYEAGEEDLVKKIGRHGRHNILPAFWTMVQTLAKSDRDFTIVLHSHSGDYLSQVIEEVNAFCTASHPAYSGKHKTKKNILDGAKGKTRDLRVGEEFVGSISRLDQTLTFAKRNPNLIRPELPEVDPVKKAETATENEKISAEPHSGSVFGPGLSGIYAGLVHQVSRESPVMGIQQDLDFWQSSMYDQASSKLFLVDSAESDVHQIFFDGSFLENKVESLLCREVAETDGGKPLPWAEMRDCFVHRCDVWGSVTNPSYFLDAIDRCEANFAARVERLRAADAGAGSDPLAGSGLDEGAKDYIYRNLVPALFPALDQCAKLRPDDPLEFLSYYLLRYSKGYNKTITTGDSGGSGGN